MKKILTSILLLSGTAAGIMAPQPAEAMKVKVQPSITFRHSHVAPRYPHRVQYHRPVVQDVEHRYFDPHTGRMVIYHTPCEYYEVVEYPVYHQPRCVSGTDYELKFKFK